MDNWKVTLEYYGAIQGVLVKGKSYSEAYINTAMDYPESRILSIKPGPAEKKRKKKKASKKTSKQKKK